MNSPIVPCGAGQSSNLRSFLNGKVASLLLFLFGQSDIDNQSSSSLQLPFDIEKAAGLKRLSNSALRGRTVE